MDMNSNCVRQANERTKSFCQVDDYMRSDVSPLWVKSA